MFQKQLKLLTLNLSGNQMSDHLGPLVYLPYELYLALENIIEDGF